MIVRCVGVHTAASGKYQHRFVLKQANRAGFGVFEGNAGTGNVVDPGLELRRHAEVVHRQADHHDIGITQLCHQCIRFGHQCLLFGAALICRGKEGADPVAVQMRQRLVGKVALDHLTLRIGRLPALDKVTGQLAAVAVVAEDAAADIEKRCHVEALIGRLDNMAPVSDLAFR